MLSSPELAQRANGTDELIAKQYQVLQSIFRKRCQNPADCDLLHDAYIHLKAREHSGWEDSNHFTAIIVRKMRQVVFDQVKREQAQKRGGRAPIRDTSKNGTQDFHSEFAASRWNRVPLDSVVVAWHDPIIEKLDFLESFKKLGYASSRLRKVLYFRLHRGLTHAQVAQKLRVSPSTAEKDYRHALKWLHGRLDLTFDNGIRSTTRRR